MTVPQHWTETKDPRRIQRGLFGSITVWVIGFCLLFGAIGVVGWQVGWWLKKENVERQVDIANNNTGTQTAWRDEVLSSIRDYEVIDPENQAARNAVRVQACNIIPRLNEDYLDDQIVEFELEHC